LVLTHTGLATATEKCQTFSCFETRKCFEYIHNKTLRIQTESKNTRWWCVWGDGICKYHFIVVEKCAFKHVAQKRAALYYGFRAESAGKNRSLCQICQLSPSLD